MKAYCKITENKSDDPLKLGKIHGWSKPLCVYQIEAFPTSYILFIYILITSVIWLDTDISPWFLFDQMWERGYNDSALLGHFRAVIIKYPASVLKGILLALDQKQAVFLILFDLSATFIRYC